MPDVAVERRGAPRYPMVLAVQVFELPRGAKLTARTSDISRTGCYIDTLNPSPVGTRVRLRVTHHDEILEVVGAVVYTSHSLGMGIYFTEIVPEELAKLDRWLANSEEEY